MLEQLRIVNIALFEEAVIDFKPGLLVLTGETGAGKSLVVDAVSFLCGNKADKGLIRSGSEKAIVEGLFHIAGMDSLHQFLKEADLQIDGDQLMIYREINQIGRSVCRIEGVPVSLAFLKEVGSYLIDLHGQHEHQSLLKESSQLQYLDLLGDTKHQSLIQKVSFSYENMKNAEKAYHEALFDHDQQQDRLNALHHRLEELSLAKLVPGEEEALQKSRALLRNAEKINKALSEAIILLADNQFNHDTALSLQRQAAKVLSGIEGLSPDFQKIQERADSLAYEIEELGHDIQHQLNSVDSDYSRLEEVEARLDLIRKLSRKYGASIEEMLQTLDETKKEINHFEHLDDILNNLQILHAKNEKEYFEKAECLSRLRNELAKIISKKIEDILKELNMSATSFTIQVTQDKNHPTSKGYDKVAMLLSPNLGEEQGLLSKIASGGELSRIMLALKALTAHQNEVPTMVFDEIDTGVSGKTAQVIAEKLWDIAKYRQVICVTHLHQLASMASTHLYISKTVSFGRTIAQVKQLEKFERVNEIAKMLGDLNTQGESSLQHAQVLLQDAERYRKFHKA